MTPLEIFEHVGQLAGHGFRIERKHAINDVIGACLVGRIEVARLGRRLERTHNHTRRIGTQIKSLTIQEWKL